MNLALWLLVATPTAVGVLLAVVGAVRKTAAVQSAAGLLAVSTSAVVLVLAVAVAVGRPSVQAPFLPGADATLAVDALSAVMVLVVAAVTPLVLLFATGDLGSDDARARFFGLMLVFEGAMLLTVTATSFVILLAGWEVMGATSYALIAFWWGKPAAVRAANVAFLTTRGADLGLYVAAGAALAGTGSLALTALPAASGGWLHVATAGIVLAALGKSAQLPFSFWLSKAMEGPSPVSALLHSATMVAAGGYLLLRVRPTLEATEWAGPSVAWIGAITALTLGAVATAQHDFKQLLAASTAAQIGFVVLAAGVGATAGGTMQLVAHAAVKSALFLAAGAWLTALGTKQLPALRGAARRHRVLGTAAVVALLALAGIPPLSLWATKDSVLAVVAEQSLALYAVALAAAGLSAAYAGRAIAVVLDRHLSVPPAEQVEEQPAGRVTGRVTAAVVVLAAAGAILGVQALPAIQERYADSLGGGAVAPGPAELAASGLLAVAVATVVVVRRRGHVVPAGRLGAWLTGWLALEPAAMRIAVRPVLALAHGLAVLDDRLLDRGVVAFPLLIRTLARRLAAGDDRM
ncbi:MAG: NADH-quinone oxidoreductase subunit L, partial [Actinomycetota bacterium]|nr:NADH-quinone oxidoreductase subunit L [Actinomycetota bacterium]